MVKHQGAERVVRALDKEMKRRKRGTITAISQLMKRSRSWWHQRRKAGDVSVGQMMGILDYLDLDAVRFLRQALHEDGLSLDLEKPKTAPSEIVLVALHRFQIKDRPGTLGASFLETLDSIRYERPHEALEKATWGVEHVDRALLARFLGVVASIFRHLSRLDDAEHALFAGINLADISSDHEVVAELVQRRAYVVGERGQLETALRLSESAMIAYLRCGSAVGAAQAIIDQAVWMSRLGRCKETILLAETGLKWLPETEEVNRCAAYQLIARNWFVLGDLDRAWECIAKVREIAKDNSILIQDKLDWLTANILAALGRLSEAEGLLISTIERVCRYRNGEDALLICDLVEVQLRLGKLKEAHETAIMMLKLLEPMRHDRIISAAIEELLRLGEKGLTLALVDRVRTKIEGELCATLDAQKISR